LKSILPQKRPIPCPFKYYCASGGPPFTGGVGFFHSMIFRSPRRNDMTNLFKLSNPTNSSLSGSDRRLTSSDPRAASPLESTSGAADFFLLSIPANLLNSLGSALSPPPPFFSISTQSRPYPLQTADFALIHSRGVPSRLTI